MVRPGPRGVTCPLIAAMLLVVLNGCAATPRTRGVLIVEPFATTAPVVSAETSTVTAASELPDASPATPAPLADGAKVVSFKGDVVPVLRKHCIACHVPGGPVPDHGYFFDAKGEPDYPNIKDHAGVMLRMIRSGEMPEGKPGTVTKEEQEVLNQWRLTGSPNN